MLPDLPSFPVLQLSLLACFHAVLAHQGDQGKRQFLTNCVALYAPGSPFLHGWKPKHLYFITSHAGLGSGPDITHEVSMLGSLHAGALSRRHSHGYKQQSKVSFN
ncbi:hypothetical protein EV126DRAFT_405222 [Verticillium dahliae]|nr:hypothetical protein EV126DRAFT_405222 [Verticillium dahliae]